MRVVYMDGLHGRVEEVSDAGYYARLRLDNGTVDWFRTDLMEPEDAVPGGGEAEEPPGVWTDRAGFVWLEALPDDDGRRRAFCYDAAARRRMSDAWRVQPLEDADGEFGPLTPMVPGSSPGGGAEGPAAGPARLHGNVVSGGAAAVPQEGLRPRAAPSRALQPVYPLRPVRLREMAALRQQ